MGRAEYQRQWREQNRDKVRGYWRKHRASHREEYRNRKMATRYGIPRDVFEVMLTIQEGRCAICGVGLTEPCIDHDHQRHYTRGLLCHRCNLGLGYFHDSPLMLMRAAVYLRERIVGEDTEAVAPSCRTDTVKRC